MIETDADTQSMRDFAYVKGVGYGGYGCVVLVRTSLGQERRQVAMKQMIKSHRATNVTEDSDQLTPVFPRHPCQEREAEILQKLAHTPFCLKVLQTFETVSFSYLVTEYYSGGSLWDYICSRQEENNGISQHLLEPQQFITLAAELTTAIGWIHNKGIMHRDLKPANILIDSNGHSRIVDFGAACYFTDDQGCRHAVGTVIYRAPELFRPGGHSQMVDWWGLGITLFTTLVGSNPFRDKDLTTSAERNLEIWRRCRDDSVGKYLPNGYPTIITSFLTALMRTDPAKRLGANSGVKEVKKHQLFACNFKSPFDWQKLQNEQMRPPFQPGKVYTHSDQSKLAEVQLQFDTFMTLE